MLKLRQWRVKRGLGQTELARKVGLHRVYIAQLETGARQPSLTTLKKLAKVLGVGIEDLLR